jgi:hypothetical protein
LTAIVDPKVGLIDDADALLLESLLSSEAEMDFDTHYGLLAPS